MTDAITVRESRREVILMFAVKNAPIMVVPNTQEPKRISPTEVQFQIRDGRLDVVWVHGLLIGKAGTPTKRNFSMPVPIDEPKDIADVELPAWLTQLLRSVFGDRTLWNKGATT